LLNDCIEVEGEEPAVARTSSIRCSNEAALVSRSDRPWPLLSNVTTRANFDRRRKKDV